MATIISATAEGWRYFPSAWTEIKCHNSLFSGIYEHIIAIFSQQGWKYTDGETYRKKVLPVTSQTKLTLTVTLALTVAVMLTQTITLNLTLLNPNIYLCALCRHPLKFFPYLLKEFFMEVQSRVRGLGK